jgi:small Trp-rich protein
VAQVFVDRPGVSLQECMNRIGERHTENDMPLIILILALIGLRYFEVWIFAQMSWWWVVLLMVFAFVWFEFLERIFGLDKRTREHALLEKQRKERLEKTFGAKRK